MSRSDNPQQLGSRFIRLSPLVLMVAAFVALTVFLVHGAPPAAADGDDTTLLSTTLTVKDVGSGDKGCSDTGAAEIRCSVLLTDDNFTYGGVGYDIIHLYVSSGSLVLVIDNPVPDGLESDATLNVGTSEFSLADGVMSTTTQANDTVTWSSTDLTWTVDNTVALSLTAPDSDAITVSDVDGYHSAYRIVIFVSSIGTNLTMSRTNTYTANRDYVKIRADGTLTTGIGGTPLTDRYYWSCNPVNGSTGEGSSYAIDSYSVSLPQTDLSNAPLRESTFGRRVLRICNGDEDEPSNTQRTAWGEFNSLPAGGL